MSQRAFQISLADTAVYNLRTLIDAAHLAEIVADPTLADSIVPCSVKQLFIQADGGNGAATIFVGDKKVGTTNYSQNMSAGDGYSLGDGGENSVYTGDVGVKASAAAKFNVTLHWR